MKPQKSTKLYVFRKVEEGERSVIEIFLYIISAKFWLLPIGTIMAVAAVFEIHMERNIEHNMNPAEVKRLFENGWK